MQNRVYIRYFSLGFFPLALFLSAFNIFFYNNEKQNVIDAHRNTSAYHADLIKKDLHGQLGNIASDLRILSEHYEWNRKGFNEVSLTPSLEKEFQIYLKNKRLGLGLQFIDTDFKTIFSFQSPHGGKILSSEFLVKTFDSAAFGKMKPGDVYFSFFEIPGEKDSEGSNTELEFYVVTPVSGMGRKIKGYLILAQGKKDLVEIIKTNPPGVSCEAILAVTKKEDSVKYIILGESEHRHGNTHDHAGPIVMEKMAKMESGDFYSGNGYYVFRTISLSDYYFPGEAEQNRYTDSRIAPKLSEWKIIVHLPDEIIENAVAPLFYKIIFVNSIGLISLAFFSFLFAGYKMKKEKMQLELDIHRNNLEEIVRHRTSSLTELNQELKFFSSIISHDLRPNLQRMVSFCANIGNTSKENVLNNNFQEQICGMGSTLEHMFHLIDDFLSLTRARNAELHYQKIDLAWMCKEAIEMLEKEWMGRNIGWILPDPSVEISGDPGLLRQVFINLLSNAIKYSRVKDPAKIEISVRMEPEQMVTVCVKDNGAGFDEKYGDRLFKAFQRLHSDEDFEGTGIGLAIVKSIVQRHGGTVSIAGKLNEGVTVCFTLPAEKLEENMEKSRL